MADIWMDVDAALSEVPVNILPLIDATDFKTRKEAVAYNTAGLELIWHFTTTAGATSATVVTPTTGGAYDWAHQDGGMYTIEIPASGGASINNDAEGFGWFTGVATGVLPWRGPIIGFRAAGLNNLLIDDAYSTTRGLAGTALPDAAADAAGGLPISDAGGLDLDTYIKRIEGAITATILGRIDAAISSRSTHTAADVWSAATRSLTDKTGFQLAATQGDYAPAKAGDKMDLIDAPNATALAAVRTAVQAAGSTLATLLSRIVGTLATGTHNPQSGDAYARLGAPAGASIAADIGTRLATAGYTAAVGRQCGRPGAHRAGHRAGAHRRRRQQPSGHRWLHRAAHRFGHRRRRARCGQHQPRYGQPGGQGELSRFGR